MLMDQLTHNVRRNSWINIITECQQRPADVTAKQWLAENGIKEKAYYYWLRKLRREAGEQMNLPAATAPAELAFAEIPIPVSTPAKSVENSNTVAVIHTGSITLEVSNNISESLLRVLLQEVTHA